MSKKISFAIIGFGKIAKTKFLPALLLSADAELGLIVTSKKKIVKEYIQKISVDVRVVDYEEFFSEKSINWMQPI